MKRTLLAFLVAVGLVEAAAEIAEAQRSGDLGGRDRAERAAQLMDTRLAAKLGGLHGAPNFSHSQCDCYDFTVLVGTLIPGAE
jgi:hypothetical protein